jgi:hypothetical protein
MLNPFQQKYFIAVLCSLNILLSTNLLLATPHTSGADSEWQPILPGKTIEDVHQASYGCLDCHTKTDSPSMHTNPAVHIGCTDCHGGNAAVRADTLDESSPEWLERIEEAHVVTPQDTELWQNSANPMHSYAGLLQESAEFVKFVNPGDLRVAPETCGGCHAGIVNAVKKSLMTTSAMLWGGASYNNGILPNKVYSFGENYTRDGDGAAVQSRMPPTEEELARGVLPRINPLPPWEVIPPADVFRVFERGGLFIRSQFAEVGLPNPLEEAGRPDVRQSNRGPATGARIAVPVLNIFKTRLNDPHLSFMGTNDHPGDYRSSGCTSCHTIYANDRDPQHSGPYSEFGHEGMSQSVDPTIPKDREGHPIKHAFTRAIPTSQCMVCHMHQPNMFVNTYLGFTMWDYESDAQLMWPKEQKNPSNTELHESLTHNPEEAAARGLWTDKEFLKRVSEMNDKAEHTQFADYHGHGWNFRAVFKRDRKGHLLDEAGEIISFDDPEKFKKAVHLADIHAEKGMHCMDCHFAQDSHGDGHIYGEVANAVEIGCKDCHGDIDSYANLRTSGPAAPEGGNDLSLMRTPFGERRFIWKEGELYQRSSLTEGLEWKVSQVRDSVDAGHSEYNTKSARAKTLKRKDTATCPEELASLDEIDESESLYELLAHNNETMDCYACHSSWITTCAGCHLPIQANFESETKHYDKKTTRNWASYNPQVARDDAYQLGIHTPVKGSKIVPVRSSSALVLSSTDVNRRKIYIQQPPVSSAGFSSQAFAPHFPHTVRKTETKTCEDCHISDANDNNAIMSQLFLLGTNFLNFLGHYAYVATGSAGFEAVQVTEWSEPQSVIGSYLHKFAYPDNYAQHQARGMQLEFSKEKDNLGGTTQCVQMRGEYLYAAEGTGGFRAYDIANVANKDFSQKVTTAPFSPLGHDTHIATTDASCFALATTMPVALWKERVEENLEQEFHEIYRYAFITDRVEGLILTDIDTLSDGDPRNNFFRRALTWNPDGILNGARTIQLAGSLALIGTDTSLVFVDLDRPLEPKVISILPFEKVTGIAVQFRYVFVTDAQGMHVVDITDHGKPQLVPSAKLVLEDARGVYVSRTFAYVANGKHGLTIVDVEVPTAPKVYRNFSDEGRINDLNDVKIASTNATLYAYLADGKNGLKVVQLTDPDRTPAFYGFSPLVQPVVIAERKTRDAALAISKPLDRDRAVDETGNQVSVFGRLGSRPMNSEEMRKFYIHQLSQELFTVRNEVPETGAN